MEEIITKYNLMYKNDLYKKYLPSKIINDKNSDTALQINKNFDNMSDNNRKQYLLNCMTKIDIERELLRYELFNLNNKEDKYDELESFISFSKKVLLRYQWKAGGFDIEDDEWELYRTNFKDYIVNENCAYFENTVDIHIAKEPETDIFMNNIVRILNNASSVIRVEYLKNTDKKNSIIWIYLKISDITKINKPPIGL